MSNPALLPVRVKRKWWQFWRLRWGMEFRPFTQEYVFPEKGVSYSRITMR